MKLYKLNTKFLLSLLMVGLCSCANINMDKVAPSYNEAFVAIRGALFGFSDIDITRELINEIPYASALLKIGKGPKGLVILERLDGNKSIWVSADNIVIVIKEGKIVRTLGLPNNLILHSSPSTKFADLVTSKNPLTEYIVYYSFDKPALHGLRVEVSASIKKTEDIEILGEVRSLILIEESLQNKEINWKKTNKYWVDPKTYYVWKSIQYISPKLPPFNFEITKKPAG